MGITSHSGQSKGTGRRESRPPLNKAARARMEAMRDAYLMMADVIDLMLDPSPIDDLADSLHRVMEELRPLKEQGRPTGA